jgi:hypothetical protein
MNGLIFIGPINFKLNEWLSLSIIIMSHKKINDTCDVNFLKIVKIIKKNIHQNWFQLLKFD